MTAPGTSTFLRTVVEYFVQRRERGTAVSSADLQLVTDWELAGHPVAVVLSGIDLAFDRRRDPPRSLRDCARWVRAEAKRWSGVETDDDAEATPAAVAPPPRSAVAVAQAVEARLARRMRERAARAGSGPVAEAWRALADELDEIVRTDGRADAQVLAALDDAWVDLLLERLPPDQATVLARGPAEGEDAHARRVRERFGARSIFAADDDA